MSFNTKLDTILPFYFILSENGLNFIFIGWNGKHCTIEGCPSNCNGHGQCKANNALEWECLCDSGWYGAGCNIYLEQDCSDRKDNDGGKYKRTRSFQYQRIINQKHVSLTKWYFATLAKD